MMTTLRESLPRPLAVSLHAVENASAAELGQALEKFVELFVRYGTLVDLALYVTVRDAPGGASDPKLEARLAGWAKPGFGTRLDYLREVQRGLERVGEKSSLPQLSSTLSDERIVEFTRRVTSTNQGKFTLDAFLGAVVKWRNDGAHTGAVRRHGPEQDILKAGVAEMLGHCVALRTSAPVWVDGAQLLGGRGKSGRAEISYWAAVGTALPSRKVVEVDAAWGIGGRALHLWQEPQPHPLRLSPFFQWSETEQEVLLLDTIEKGQPTFSAYRAQWTDPDPGEDLRQTAGFLFARAPAAVAAATAQASASATPRPAIAAFTALLKGFLADGDLSSAERTHLEITRVALGLSREEADAVLAEHGVELANGPEVPAPARGGTAVPESPTGPGLSPGWDESSYFDDLTGRGLPASVVGVHRELFQHARDLAERRAIEVAWGHGKAAGSFSMKLGETSLLAAYSDGRVTLNVGAWHRIALGSRIRMLQSVAVVLGLPKDHPRVQLDARFPNIIDDLVQADPQGDGIGAWLQAVAAGGLRVDAAPVQEAEQALAAPDFAVAAEQAPVSPRPGWGFVLRSAEEKERQDQVNPAVSYKVVSTPEGVRIDLWVSGIPRPPVLLTGCDSAATAVAFAWFIGQTVKRWQSNPKGKAQHANAVGGGVLRQFGENGRFFTRVEFSDEALASYKAAADAEAAGGG